MKSFAKGFTAYEAVGRAGLRASAPTQVQTIAVLTAAGLLTPQSRVCFPPCDMVSLGTEAASGPFLDASAPPTMVTQYLKTLEVEVGQNLEFQQ